MLALAGYTFCARYLSRGNTNPVGKNLTLAEAQQLSAAGLRILLVWENVAADRDPLKGATQGALDAAEALRQATACGAPPDVVLYFAVDWNASRDEFVHVVDYFRGVVATIGDRARVGCYGHTYLLAELFDAGLIGHGWVPMAASWSAGYAEPRAHLRQTATATVGGAAADINEADTDQIGLWRLPVTFAPVDLLAVQRYVRAQTGLDWASLGIVGDPAHAATGGYHVGWDDLAAAGRAPGDQYPYRDYSYGDYPPDRQYLLDTHSDAASAFDLGAGFSRFREITLKLVDACKRGDPRARDIREIIYTPDGVTVHRWDRLGIQPDSGDSSHLSHTHISLFRCAEGRRAAADNLLGLMVWLFEGRNMTDFDTSVKGADGSSRLLWRQLADLEDSMVLGVDFGKTDGVVGRLKRLEGKVDTLAVGGLDLDALAAKVAALMPKPPTAAEVAEELARRIGNG